MVKDKLSLFFVSLLLFSIHTHILSPAAETPEELSLEELTADIPVYEHVIADFSLMHDVNVNDLLKAVTQKLHATLPTGRTDYEAVKLYKEQVSLWALFLTLAKKTNSTERAHKMFCLINKIVNAIQYGGFIQSYESLWLGETRKNLHCYFYNKDSILNQPQAYIKRNEVASYAGAVPLFTEVQRQTLINCATAQNKQLFFKYLRIACTELESDSIILPFAIGRFFYNFFKPNALETNAAQKLSTAMAIKITELIQSAYSLRNASVILQSILWFAESHVEPEVYEEHKTVHPEKDFTLNIDTGFIVDPKKADLLGIIYDFYCAHLSPEPPPYSYDTSSELPEYNQLQPRFINISALRRHLNKPGSRSDMSWD